VQFVKVASLQEMRHLGTKRSYDIWGSKSTRSGNMNQVGVDTTTERTRVDKRRESGTKNRGDRPLGWTLTAKTKVDSANLKDTLLHWGKGILESSVEDGGL